MRRRQFQSNPYPESPLNGANGEVPEPGATSDTFDGNWTTIQSVEALTAAQVAELFAGRWYVNIHSVNLRRDPRASGGHVRFFGRGRLSSGPKSGPRALTVAVAARQTSTDSSS